MTELLFIHWNPDPVAFSLFGREIRWYSLCWCVGLLLGYFVMKRLYQHQGISKEKFEPIFIYVFVGVLAGARLGHCLFYEPGYYLSHPLQMLLPIRELHGVWRCTGYEGLSSHGGVLGMFVSLWLYVRRTGVGGMRVLDNMGVCAPVTACFIRLGNLFNSEIVGKTTAVPWGFIFEANGDTAARHPAQLYESLMYLAVFVIGLLLYKAYSRRIGTGFFFGWCLTSIFTFRFAVEFIKEVQEDFENAILLDMGQILSIPLIVIGVYCLAGGRLCRRFSGRVS